MGTEANLSKMIAEYDAARLRADGIVEEIRATAAEMMPKKSPIFGILPNQIGRDTNGSGTPDGYEIFANGGYTSLELVESLPPGNPADLVFTEEQAAFYDDLRPGVPRSSLGYFNVSLPIWRFSWDLTDVNTDLLAKVGGVPVLRLFSSTDNTPWGTLGCWLKAENDNILENLLYGQSTTEETNKWGVFTYSRDAGNDLKSPLSYLHSYLCFKLDTLPAVGSVLFAGRQCIPVTWDAEALGWYIFPTLSRTRNNGEWEYILKKNAQSWEQ